MKNKNKLSWHLFCQPSLLSPAGTFMKSWAHIHQDNFHALWNLVSLGLVLFYVNKIRSHYMFSL